jgi:hypothetical protein
VCGSWLETSSARSASGCWGPTSACPLATHVGQNLCCCLHVMVRPPRSLHHVEGCSIMPLTAWREGRGCRSPMRRFCPSDPQVVHHPAGSKLLASLHLQTAVIWVVPCGPPLPGRGCAGPSRRAGTCSRLSSTRSAPTLRAATLPPTGSAGVSLSRRCFARIRSAGCCQGSRVQHACCLHDTASAARALHAVCSASHIKPSHFA